MKQCLMYCYIPKENNSIKYDELIKFSHDFFKRYCFKYGIDLVGIHDRAYDIKECSHYNVLIYEKNQIAELFNVYERIFRVDVDMLISSGCPNVFDVVPESKIGAVFEDVGSRQSNRRVRIKAIQDYFGEVDGGWSFGYFNAGMVVASKRHAEVFMNDIDLLNNVACSENPPKYTHDGDEDILLTDQSILNYNVRKMNHEIFPMSYKFNHLKFFSERWNGKAKMLDSYITHYAGYENKEILMKEHFDYFCNGWDS